ncbi:MAG: insulinase family protein [Chloroflexota bacterium]
MTKQHGFELIREDYIKEVDSHAKLYKHVQSGAEFLSLSNSDENKVFGVTFKTPPKTSNGIAHIMEHSVLCGSDKYPLKEPFVELIKGSLKTFLNAFTYPDKTCYPVASTNTQDFYNLIDVYLDAVFHPLIEKHHLDQEGWHFEMDSLEDELSFKGVVFNEMKGAYSSPDGVMYRHTKEALFDPSHPYGVDSGGDPKEILNLTYEEFKDFHETYYHPSNSRIYMYGDDDLDTRLEMLDKVLSDFKAIEVNSEIPLYPLRDEPNRESFPYVIEEEQSADAKNYVTVNWLLPEITDRPTQMGLSIMSYVLSGSPGAPLQRRLIESGLGEDTLGGGIQSAMRQPVFGSGLKGVNAENIEKVESLVLSILEDLSINGFDPDEIASAMNTVEFRMREANTGGFPRGLSYMLSSLSDWLHGGDPIEALRYEEELAAVKEKIAAGGYFESLLKEYVLDNNHRTTIVLEPDTELKERLETEEAERLSAARQSFTQEQLAEIVENTKTLKELQEAPNDPEALANLPSLALSDLEKHVSNIPIEIKDHDQVTMVSHDLFTNQIIYTRVGMNLRVIPQNLLPYVPLFSYALTEIGLEEMDYVKLSQQIGMNTGGIGASRMIANKRDSEEALAWLWLRGKATTDKADDLLALMRKILLTVNLDNKNRFQQMLLEEKAGEEAGLIPAGHSVALGRLRAAFTEADYISESMGGVNYLFFLRKLVDEVENDWEGVLAKLSKIRQLLVNKNIMLTDTTLDGENYVAYEAKLKEFLDSMPAAEPIYQTWEQGTFPANEGLTIPAQVNYVALGANVHDAGFKYHGSWRVAQNMLGTGYLWDRVRMRGGAYGAMAPYNPNSGLMSFVSYRDPNLTLTIDVYKGAADFFRNLEMSQSEIDKAIIGVIGSMDGYQLADAKGHTSLIRYLHGTTDDYRQRIRDEVLGTTLKDLQAFGDVLAEVSANGRIVVVGSTDALNAANEEAGYDMEIQPLM